MDTRVKCRVHPGRVQYTTPVAEEGGGTAPIWNDAFEVACPGGDRADADYVPCLSLRYVQRRVVAFRASLSACPLIASCL